MAVSRYVLSTGDTGVLDEPVPFIEGRQVNTDEDSYYDLPVLSEQTAGVYDHCVRAIMRGLSFGGHGLPLIGSGDWNDGMNRVGEQGKGKRRKRLAGTVSGISERTSIMAHHSVHMVIRNARLIPFRKAGLFYPAPGMPNAQPWQWRQWISASFDATID